MNKSETKRRVKALSELVTKIDDAIPKDASHLDVLDALCIILGNQCVYTRKIGMNKHTYFEMLSDKLARAISVAEIIK
jgi:hypothetical protein